MPAATRFAPGALLPAHRHADAYCAVVLDGAYEELSADGRFQVAAGEVVVHPPWHSHVNYFLAQGAVVTDLACPRLAALDYGVFRVADPEAVARGTVDLEDALRKAHRRPSLVPPLTLDALAQGLRGRATGTVASRCEALGLRRDSATRAFTEWFGMAPGDYAREYRLRRALARLAAGVPLAQVAIGAGFCDQAHMSREFRRRLNCTPRELARATPGPQQREHLAPKIRGISVLFARHGRLRPTRR